MHVKRSLNHRQRAKLTAILAERNGVTVEHFLAVVAARKAYRRAKMFRSRSRRRHLEKNPKARRGALLTKEASYAAEGEFSQLLRMADMTQRDFAVAAGIHFGTVSQWCGHPMQSWPMELLRHYLWRKNAEKYFADRGIDIKQFETKLPERVMPTGRYPRKSGQVKFNEEQK